MLSTRVSLPSGLDRGSSWMSEHARRRWWPSLARPAALLLIALAWTSSADAQVNVTATAGTPAASYTTLKGAFDAVNAGAHQGVVGVAIVADSTETAPAVLNASGAGSAVYTSMTISPSGGAPRSISGAIVAGSPLIDFNGADNVTIDGLNTGGNALTIANTTVSATSGTSTIRFIGGATANTITNANIQGASSASVATNGATIFFSTDAATANGNDNNTISNNNIGPVGANLPSKAILGNGSTTTTAIGNSGIVITNNNIFDFFGAAVTSSGIATNGGCNTWSITNNRLYQTAARTWTTGALHVPIDIRPTTATHGAQGFTITGNIVGFASSTQTGTYTLTGAGTGAKFVGILFSGIVTGATTNVNNNTVAAVSLTGITGSGTTTSSPFTAILIQEGNGISNGNTIGSQAVTGSLTFSTTTTTATDVYGILNFSSNAWTSNSNTVGGISVTNLGASGTFLVYGMRAFTGSAVTWSASSNVVGGNVANSIQLAATGAASQVIGLFTSLPLAVLNSNTVRNLTSNIGTGTTTTASVIGISITAATPSHSVTQNTIAGLTNTNATAASVVTGIQFTGGAANVVARNRVDGLTVATTSAAAEVNGIRIAGGTTSYRNNMIAIGAGIPSAIGTGSTTGGVNGIFEAGGLNNVFHNSVYVGGAPGAGVGPSYAFASAVTSGARSYRDNIFFNARSNAGATGKNYAIRVGGTTVNPAGLASNNNILYSSGSGAVFGFFNSLDVATIAAWKAVTGQDTSSFFVDPQFSAPVAAIPDLHIHPSNPTPAESNGADVGVVDDFDGATRASLTPTDIGADAGNFVGVDLAAPVISYSTFGNTSLTTNRTLVATLTDVSGVAIGGLAPRIYYRKNAGAYFSQACGLATGTVNSGTWNCLINNADMGGVALADAITYFVVAQDLAGNLASNPSGAVATDVNNISAVPASLNTYSITAALAGTIAVGTGETFTSLTNPGGVFETLNGSVITSNVVINITSDLLAETGTHALNKLSEKGAGNYTVMIHPGGAARTISGSFAGALIRMNGANRVTIDGSIDGLGADRSLTIQNNSVTSPSVVLFGSVGTTPITDGTLRNCVVINGANTSSAVVISDATIVGNAGLFSNITIQNNDVQRAFVGVFATGGTTPQGGSNLVLTQNTLGTGGANAIRNVGLYMQGVNGATVSQNAVANLSNVEGENDTGIWLATGTGNATVSGNTVNNLGMTLTTAFAPFGIRESSGLAASGNSISGNTVTNLSTTGGTGLRGITVGSGGVTVQANKIQGVINNSSGTFGSFGIDVVAGNDAVIKNNFISDVNHNMTGGAAFSPDFGVIGIRLGAGTGHKVYNNSVNLFGPHTGTATTSLLSAAFSIGSTTQTGVDVRDNIFANNISGGTTSIAHVSVFLPSGGTAAMNLTWNNNAYFSGTDAARQGVGQAGTTAGTNFYTTLAPLAAYSSTLSAAGTNDNASQASTAAVPFLTANDLHLQPSSVLATAGVPLAGVTTDIDNDPRPATTPSIGADELAADLSITKTDGVANATPGGSVTYTITAANAGPGNTSGTVVDTFPAALTCTWTCTGAGSGTCTAAGAGNINDAVVLPSAGSVTYTASCTISASATGSLSNTATVSGLAGDANLANNSATDTDTLTASANLGITKTDGVASATPGGSTTYTITASNAGPSNTSATVADTFPAALTCTWTCAGAGGGTCTAAGSGNINDAVNLPAGGSVTHTASCSISGAATGSLSNTATVTGSATDPVPGNNSATDTDTLSATADLGITKTDGVTTATPGGSVTYTITASNAGPSNATGATVTDTFPAALTCTWTCAGAGGGTCTASGSGNISNPVNLPSGGSVTYTAMCAVSPSATGTLSNTATVSAPGGVTDPTPGNNSATDSDTLPTCGAQSTVYVDDNWVATTIGTDPDGAGPATQFGCDSFATVQGGVNGVTAGGNVIVLAGIYNEPQVLIQKAVTVTGAGAATTTLNGGNTPIASSGLVRIDLPLVEDGNVIFSGFTVTNPGLTGGSRYHIFGKNQSTLSTVTISNVSIVGSNLADYGFYSDRPRGTIVFDHNTLTNNQFNPILIERPMGATDVHHNTISGNASSAYFNFTYSAQDVSGQQRVADNTISGATASAIVFNSAFGGSTGKFSNVSIVNNTITALAATRIGISLTNSALAGSETAGAIESPILAGNIITGTDAATSKGIRLNGLVTNASISRNDVRHLARGFSGEVINGHSATGTQAHFNNIVGNASGLFWDAAAAANAENNWWGCNAGPGAGGCDSIGGANVAGVDFNPWLVLGVNASPNPILPFGASTATANMTRNSDLVDTSGSGTIPSIPVAFSATQGTIAPPAGTITLGLATATFTSTSGSSGTACAMVDTQLVCAPVGVTQQADLAITKTDGVTTATAGGSVTYTITASNAGPSNAPGSTIADTFPAALTCTWTCTGAGGGTCTAAGSGNINDSANLPTGGSVSYTAICAISPAATGSLSNTATVAAAAGITDLIPGNNAATDTDALGASADLSITKTDGVTSATAGGSVTYTITASNAGPSNATGATVTDTFPAALTCTWTCAGTGGGTCTASGSGNINNTVNLPSAGSTTYTASCSISPSATGALTNTATVTAPAGVTDPTPGNNAATDIDALGASADLSITKTDGVTAATAGGSVTYTITASNAGPSAATGASVADSFPVACVSPTWTCVGAGGGTCAASGSGNIAGTVNLPSGGSVTYSATCPISASATGLLVNTATVTAPAGVTDPTPGNNSATDTDALGASSDLSITKTDGVTSATAGGSVTYTIVAGNSGPSTATGATVADTFPAACVSPTWTCSGAGGGTCVASGSGNIAGSVNLPVSASVTYLATCPISASATGSLVNTATIAAPAGATDPTPGNNSATDTDALGASADLSITKTDGVTSVNSGSTLTYTIVARNAGPSAVTGATVTDTFPVQCASATWTCAGGAGGTCTASGSGNIAGTVNLPVNATATYTASCPTVATTPNGTVISNTASIAAPAGVTDTNPGNNSAIDTTTAVLLGTGISATKTVAGGNQPGNALTYTIVIGNAGPGPQGDNPGNELIDVLPAQLTLVSATASSGTAVATTGTNTVTWNGAIPTGGSVTITINSTIKPTATGNVSNQATVNHDVDGNGTNESTLLTDDPGVGGSANATIFGIQIPLAPVVPIPALNWLALFGLMLGMGYVARRRLSVLMG